jgi:hypothetical protein
MSGVRAGSCATASDPMSVEQDDLHFCTGDGPAEQVALCAVAVMEHSLPFDKVKIDKSFIDKLAGLVCS